MNSIACIDAQNLSILKLNHNSWILFQRKKQLAMSRQGTRVTDTKKVSGELFALTYGALVSQIVKDYQNVEDVNKQLEKMGYNIGVRIIEDFLARTKEGKCTDFRDTAEKVQMAFKMYLNVSPTVTSWSSASDEFSLIFEVNFEPFLNIVRI